MFQQSILFMLIFYLQKKFGIARSHFVTCLKGNLLDIKMKYHVLRMKKWLVLLSFHVARNKKDGERGNLTVFFFIIIINASVRAFLHSPISMRCRETQAGQWSIRVLRQTTPRLVSNFSGAERSLEPSLQTSNGKTCFSSFGCFFI